MQTKRTWKCRLVQALRELFVVAVLVASYVSLCDPQCRDRTLELTFDGVAVGLLIAWFRLLHLLSHTRRLDGSLWSWWCLSRMLFGTEVRHGLLGGYLLGITRAVIECWLMR